MTESYDKTLKKLKKDKKYQNVIFFPRKQSEEIDTGVLHESYAVYGCDDTHFSCDICDIYLDNEKKIGRCIKCHKKLGLCCFYESQWMDNINETIIFEPGIRFLCPLCIEYDL